MWHLLAQQQQQGINWGDLIDRLARTPLSQVVLFVAVCTGLRLAIAPFLAKVPPHQRTGLYTLGRILNETLDAIVYAGVFVFLIIRPFCIQAFRIPTGSMLETLQLNDFIVANKAIYRYTDPQRGDIVVFRPEAYQLLPGQAPPDGEVNIDYIKRCLGTPGDTIEFRNGVLYRNGREVNEPYKIPDTGRFEFKLVKVGTEIWPLVIDGDMVNYGDNSPERYRLTDRQKMDELRSLPPAKIPPGHYLMVGDNRPNSYDGRFWGLVRRDAIIGRSEVIWLPLSRWRRTR